MDLILVYGITETDLYRAVVDDPLDEGSKVCAILGKLMFDLRRLDSIRSPIEVLIRAELHIRTELFEYSEKSTNVRSVLLNQPTQSISINV